MPVQSSPLKPVSIDCSNTGRGGLCNVGLGNLPLQSIARLAEDVWSIDFMQKEGWELEVQHYWIEHSIEKWIADPIPIGDQPLKSWNTIQNGFEQRHQTTMSDGFDVHVANAITVAKAVVSHPFQRLKPFHLEPQPTLRRRQQAEQAFFNDSTRHGHGLV